MMNKVIVTGGAGFIGSHVVDLLIEKDRKVIVIDNLSTGNKEFIHPHATFYETDLRFHNIEDIFSHERPDGVIHLAAQADVNRSILDPVYDSEVNILGTVNLLECCQKYGVTNIVYSSTCAVYGEADHLPVTENSVVNPISFYGLSKYVSEQYIEKYSQYYSLNYSILRYSNVYGPRQSSNGEGGVISIFLNKILRGEEINIFGNGDQTRDFIHVYDVARANVAALFHNNKNQILNISTKRSTSINELFELIRMLTGYNKKPSYKPKKEGDILHSCLDNSKAINTMDWSPALHLYEGIKETLDSLIKNYFRGGCNT